MKTGRHKVFLESPGSSRVLGEFQNFSRDALNAAHQAEPWVPFLQRLSRLLLDFFECEGAALWFREGSTRVVCEAVRDGMVLLNHRQMPRAGDVGEPGPGGRSHLEWLCAQILEGRLARSPVHFTRGGIFFTNDTREPLAVQRASAGGTCDLDLSGEYRSIAIAPLNLNDWGKGLMVLLSRQEGYFPAQGLPLIETTALAVGMAATHCRTQGALRERVKELGCLYSIAKIVETPGISLDEILKRAAGILPPAWQYPGITHARILLDGQSFGQSEIEDSWQRQSADISVNGVHRGVVEVAYSQRMPDLEEGPFLEEERHLIEAVAMQVAQIVERKKAEEDRAKLRDQLRHADRLATIGQLAAGVAHEFNEPLGNILGFAELILKKEGLDPDMRRDLGKITDASLYAREVIRKLMWFAREMPPRRTLVSLNEVIGEGLYLVEARCWKAGVEIVRDLEPDLARITADPAQLHQVLMNLVVNAIQAMPEGGTIRIRTRSEGEEVVVDVEDTGTGMNEEIRSRIFMPFFTTKDVDEGTGLGLAVVHGIVSSHGGTVTVESEVGRGSRFRVRLPLRAAITSEEQHATA